MEWLDRTALGVSVRNWIAVVIVIVLLFGSFVVLRRVQRLAIARIGLRTYTADMIRRVLMGVFSLIAVFYVFGLLELQVGPLIGGLGLSGLIAAIALQPVAGNFIGSMLLHSTRAFRPGDEIESNGIAGTVIDISHRAVQIEDFDGNSVYVPNLRVLDSPLTNLTAEDPRRTVIGFQVSYDTNLRAAQQLVLQALRAVEGVSSNPPTEVLVRGFADSGVDMTAEVWHPAEEALAKRVVSEAVITVRETLAEHDIEIPFPQLVVRAQPTDTGAGPVADPAIDLTRAQAESSSPTTGSSAS
ncbi:MAG: mechanosensitive ion channel family protein [Actinomycetota bacterium]